MKKKNDHEPHPTEAWSWPSSVIPYPIERMEKRSGDIYYYFRDERGDLFYQTDRGMRIAAEMEAAIERNKQKEKR